MPAVLIVAAAIVGLGLIAWIGEAQLVTSWRENKRLNGRRIFGALVMVVGLATFFYISPWISGMTFIVGASVFFDVDALPYP